MRRYNIPESYEKLKIFTRGKIITQNMIAEFIKTLKLPKNIKLPLLNLTPSTYIGNAVKQSKSINYIK